MIGFWFALHLCRICKEHTVVWESLGDFGLCTVEQVSSWDN